MNYRLALFASVMLCGLGWCPDAQAAMPPQIVSPEAGAVVTSPFTVEATYGDISYCDTGGCQDVPAATIKLFADPDTNLKELGSCQASTECTGGKATFEVTLEPGKYVLEVGAYDDAFSQSFSEKIEITVEVAATTGDTGDTGGATSGATADTTTGDATTSGTDATEGTGTGDGGSKDGCGCRSAGDSGASLACMVTAGLLLRRRRR